MMRTAISPRLATNTFLNMTPLKTGSKSHVSGQEQTWNLEHETLNSLQRNIPVLLGWIGLALVAQHLQCIDQTRTSLLWLDDIVNITAFRRHIGAGELFTVISHQ